MPPSPASFASPAFLWYFMPATLAAYWILPRRFRNGLVAVASLLFYTWGAGEFVLLLLATMAVNYTSGVLVDSDWGRERHQRARVGILIGAVATDLTILLIWKYAGFASEQMQKVFESMPVMQILLPIGISFFTFHHLSYVVDVFRGSRRAQRSPVQFVTYIAMFPQLIAGPIVRYHEIADQLPDTRRNRWDDFAEGFPRFALGLAKKVIVADTVAQIANTVFDAPTGSLDSRTVWIGALAYTVQIYFDFSGYSDMAIGLGQMLGFRLPENFARPYSAVSITDFWRRWHMSLSRWFRDYLYIPLGGNRGSTLATYRNLYIVFALTGFWHGANWTFLVWGLFHGTLLAVERATGLASIDQDSAFAVPRRLLTFVLVVAGWVLFRAENIGQAWEMLKLMFVPDFLFGTSNATVFVDAPPATQAWLVLILGLLVVLVPPSFVMGTFIEGRTLLARSTRLAYCAVAAPYAAIVVAAGTFSPFLYFQF